jgi:pimeloyl-ACP methyl ester carboxylesterase
LIDLRGHGQSDKPHDPDCYDLECRMADIRDVLTDLHIERAHFFGYSMGGWLAFGLVVHYPKLVHSLIAGGAYPYEDALESFHGVDGSDPDAFIAALEGFIGEKIPEEAKPIRLQNDLIALAAAARHRHGFQSYLNLIKQPILLFVGDQDNRYAIVRHAAKELEIEQLVVLPGASHATALYASAALLLHITAFLQRHSGVKS